MSDQHLHIMKIVIITLILGLHSVLAGEYPFVANNRNVVDEGGVTREPEDEAWTPRWSPETYLLIRNQLIRVDNRDYFGFYIDPPGMVHEAPRPIDHVNPRLLSPGAYDFSPRTYFVGEYDDLAEQFAWTSVRYVLPQLDSCSWFPLTITSPLEDDAVTSVVEKVNSWGTDEIELHYGIGRTYVVRETPDLSSYPGFRTVTLSQYWQENKNYYCKLQPPLELSVVEDSELTQSQLDSKAGQNYPHAGLPLVQGRFEVGGALVCGRQEEGELVLYRFSCNQNTKDLPIQVFNPLEKLVWDEVSSDENYLVALMQLRPDLLEHNVGVSANRLFFRTKSYTTKLDRPGESKALRDWYLLAPFYDPVSNSYRSTLTRADFVSSESFDPNDPEFDPSAFVKELVAYELPSGHLDSLDSRGRPLGE
jgi:hypothetical protein